MKKKEIQLSNEFKVQTVKAIIAIGIFVFTYLILLTLAIALTVLCVFSGFSIIVFKPMFITIVLGIGLASLGILNLIFLLKFILKSHKVDMSHLIEIKKSDEPKVFQMIDDIVLEVGTSFPKKVFLSSDVNASVFYDSSFWSMFLPIRKNLQIGVGLVNTVTKEELRAILSHEFGHFSQKTMKVGSYVYNVNQVIYNMLYENESYETLVQKWANISGYFSIFVIIAEKINQGIRWILRKLYDEVNKSYMGLSREMEFHADDIAASVTGYVPLKKSLLRLGLANSSYDNVLNYYNGKISENQKSENVYKDQKAVIQHLAEVNNLPISNHLPDITLEELSKFDRSRLVIKNQWASHPTLDERIRNLEKTGVAKENGQDTLANDVFLDIEGIQKQITQRIFENVTYEGEINVLPSDVFLEEYKKEANSNSFSKIYNGYFDYKNPTVFDLGQCNPNEHETLFEELFSDQKVDWIYSVMGLQDDFETLKNISSKLLPVKTFDYDGVRYKRKDAANLSETLTIELENYNEKIRANDIAIYCYFKKIENKKKGSKDLDQLYLEFFEFEKKYVSQYDFYTKFLMDLEFVNVTTPFENIKANFKKIKAKEEELKTEINQFLADDLFLNEMAKDTRQELSKYTSASWEYFSENKYNDENLGLLFSALHNYAYMLSRKYFLLKKVLLAYQEELLVNQSTEQTEEFVNI
jgi:Zn-dependent protease with chaperone function